MVYDLEDLSLSLNALLKRDDTYSHCDFEMNKGAEDQVGTVGFDYQVLAVAVEINA